MIHVYLLRHGETTYNANGNRYCGRTDAPLTTKGLEQAKQAAGALRGIHLDAVYSSPLQRAALTAAIASGDHLPVITDNRLIEVDFGNWEGKTREEFVAEDPSLWFAWDSGPENARAGGTGETGSEVIYRVDQFFNEINQKHTAKTVLVVAHNGVNRLYMAHKLGMPLRNYRRLTQENAAVSLFSLDENGEINLLKLNTH